MKGAAGEPVDDTLFDDHAALGAECGCVLE